MKKILSSVLAICLALALSVTAFAADGSVQLSPVVEANPSVSDNSGTLGKYVYTATDADGVPVEARFDTTTSFDSELADQGASGVAGVYAISVSKTSGPITIDVYVADPGKAKMVLVRDDWEVLDGASLKVNGHRATFTADAAIINQYTYFALVESFDTVTVDQATEGGEGQGDDVNVGDTETTDTTPETTEPESNPTTGVALAVVPMMVAAAAVVVSKKR